MTWNEYLWFAIPAILCWFIAGVMVLKKKEKYWIDLIMILGIVIYATFIVGLWIGQERPPLKTMGETRLWYSLFLALIGYITYKRWGYGWILSFSGLVASVFVVINLVKPEIHSANLMPALQSYWFVPHVTVYILSYSLLGAATIASFIQMNKLYRSKADDRLYLFIDNLVYVGFGFLMLGLLMGALWAKDAWGHYWSWDPKETWACITCAGYLIYIHMRLQKKYPIMTLWILPISFILLMITWLGVAYLPAAQNSIHVYS
ncbi:MAG: cytochrome c biogenesis protein CcsA [Bacteroidales bacterium]|nr:cytochrome c biogenesis protein CcsA [Bacteroidales bacterium]